METKNNDWTKEEIAKFRNEMELDVEKNLSKIKHCHVVLTLLATLLLYSPKVFVFSLPFGIVYAVVLIIGAFVCFCYKRKFKTEVSFLRAGISMPDEMY
jgi:hypothetical protein